MWNLPLNHANIFSKQQTVGKMSDHELLSPDNSGSGMDNVLLAQKIISNKRGVAITMFWYPFFEKINSQGASIPDWRVGGTNYHKTQLKICSFSYPLPRLLQPPLIYSQIFFSPPSIATPSISDWRVIRYPSI